MGRARDWNPPLGGGRARRCLVLLALLLGASGPVLAGGGVPPGAPFTLEFSFPLPNTCTYQVTAVDVVPPLATPVAVPTTVTGMAGESFFIDFVAGSVPGSGTGQVTLLTESPGCEIRATVSAFYTITDEGTPPPGPTGPTGPPSPPPPSGTPSLSPDQAARSFRREARAELRDARGAFRDAVERFCAELDAIEDGPLAPPGATAADAMDPLLDALNGLFGELADAVQQAGTDVTSAGFFHFLATNGIPFRGVLAGDCDTLDRARARLARDLDRAVHRALRKLKAFSRRVARRGGGALVASISPPAVPPIAPTPAEPGPAPFKKFLEIGATFAVDRPGPGPGARQICVTGIADPADGDPVRVEIRAPGASGAMLSEGEAAIDPDTCRWLVCLGATGPDPLDPGNYLVRASQASGLLAEAAIGVPAP